MLTICRKMPCKGRKEPIVLSVLRGRNLNLVKDSQNYIPRVIGKFWQEKGSV